MAERLLAVQGQDPRGARLAATPTEGVAAADAAALEADAARVLEFLDV